MNYFQSEQVFGKFIKAKREALSLSQKELALKMGYTNLSKGIRKIRETESGAIIPKFIEKIMEVLEITEKDRKKCREEEELFISEKIKLLSPFKPFLIVRYLPVVYVRREVPENLETDELIKRAEEFTEKTGLYTCLNLNYNLRYWFYGKGKFRIDKSVNLGFWAKPDIGRLL